MARMQELKENKQHGSSFFHLAVYDNNENYPDSPTHWHDEFELQFGVRGTATVRIDEASFDLASDQVLLVPCGCIHSVDSHNESFHFQAVVFDPGMLASSPVDSCKIDYIDPVREHKIDYPLHITGKTEWEKDVIGHARKLIGLYRERPAGYELGIRGTLSLVFFGIVANNPAKRERNDDKSAELRRLKDTIVFIHENYANKITVAQMAAQCSMSVYYFCRFFKRVTGISPFDYLNRFRIERAALLLKDTDQPVISVAYDVGFNDSSYFSKIFQKYRANTPTEFRKLYRSSVRDGEHS